MFKILVIANITLAVAIGALTIFKQSAGDLQEPPNPARTELPSHATPAQPVSIENRSSAIRERILGKLRTQYLAQFLSSLFDDSDPMRRANLSSIKEEIYSDYRGLLNKLNLSISRKDRLAELLSRRETSSKYFTNVSAEVAALGIPKEFSFGRAELEKMIESEFGAEILAQVKTYDAEIPAVKETGKLTAVLASIDTGGRSDRATKLQSWLNEHPAPDASTTNATEQVLPENHSLRLERLEQISKAVGQEYGPSAGSLIREYLLQQEEALIHLHAIAQANAPKSK